MENVLLAAIFLWQKSCVTEDTETYSLGNCVEQTCTLVSILASVEEDVIGQVCTASLFYLCLHFYICVVPNDACI